MTSPAVVPELDAPADAELISAVRGGDLDAFGELFARHVDAGRRLARQLVPAPDVDDLVSDAFGKVLGVLQRGGGPDLAFRAYLLTTLRRVHVDRLRADARLRSTDDLTPYDAGVPFRDTAVEHFESSAAARAFASLPERWQLVLWHLEVEGQKPAEVAPLLGMTPNSVSALAYRAREGLRQAFVAMHAHDVTGDDADGACARTRAELGGYVRGALSRRDRAKVEAHLEQCRACAGVYLELSEVNADLAGVLAPLVLGAAAGSYLGAVSSSVVAAGSLGSALSTVAGWTGSLPGRVRELLGTQGPAAAAAGMAGLAITVAVVGGIVITTDDGPGDGSPSAGVGDRPRGGPRQPAAKVPAGGERPRRPPASTGSVPPAPAGGGPVEPALTSPTASPTAPASPTVDPTAAGPTPSDSTPADPTPSDPATAGVDASVSVSTKDLAGLVWGVQVAVRGLPPSAAGRLLVDTDAPAVALTLDRRCGPLQLGRARCRVRGPATYRFLAVPLPVVATTLSFRVDHDGEEVDPSDDVARVRLRR